MRLVFIGIFAVLLFAACDNATANKNDTDTAATDQVAVTDEPADLSEGSDTSDLSDDTVTDDIITDEAVTDDETGDDLLSDDDTAIVCAEVALNACDATPGCELSELPIVSNYGPCYTGTVPVACMASADKVCPPEQWANPEYVYDPATGRCFLFYEGCFPSSWEYQVGAYPTQCAGGAAPITLPPCGTVCHGLLPAQCSQTPDCIPLRSQRLRWGEVYDDRGNCIEADEWVGCFANSELACRDSAFYPVIDLNGQCWISNGCEPLWWQYPSLDHRCSLEGPGDWDAIPPCGTRFCDDGGELNCRVPMSACEPPATTPAIQDGCWTCVEPVSCLSPEAEDHCASPNQCGTNADCPLGYACSTMLSCYDAEWAACAPHECWTQREEALECNGLRPDCGDGVPIINDGCWVCVDMTDCMPQ